MKKMYYSHHLHMEKLGKKVNKICEPFFIQNGISYFLYQKITKEGLLCALNTDQNYSGTYLDLDQLDNDILMTHPENINVDALILSSKLFPLDETYHSYENVLNFAIKKFNYDHGLAIFYKQNNFFEMFYFATHPLNKKILNNYVCDLTKYKLFTKYFKLEASRYIRQIEEDPIKLAEAKKRFFQNRKKPVN